MYLVWGRFSKLDLGLHNSWLAGFILKHWMFLGVNNNYCEFSKRTRETGAVQGTFVFVELAHIIMSRLADRYSTTGTRYRWYGFVFHPGRTMVLGNYFTYS